MSSSTLYRFKVDLLWKLRELLHSNNFQEVPTPIMRRNNSDHLVPRFKVSNGCYLRESPAYGLRRNLEFFDKVYEIAPCFRIDEPDETHLSEFLMLDLYGLGFSLENAIDLALKVLSLAYTGPISRISMAAHLKNRFGVDFYEDATAEELLAEKLGAEFGYKRTSFLKLLDKYIKNHIEPTSKDRCLVVTDFPDVAEVRAKRIGRTLLVSRRFEFLINGIEVFHGYEDETCLHILHTRAKELGQFGPEDEIMSSLLRCGSVSSESAGFGFGIERLCQVCLDEPDIQKFIISREFT